MIVVTTEVLTRRAGFEVLVLLFDVGEQVFAEFLGFLYHLRVGAAGEVLA